MDSAKSPNVPSSPRRDERPCCALHSRCRIYRRMSSSELRSALQLALDSELLLLLFLLLLRLHAEATFTQQLVAFLAAPLLQAVALDFFTFGVEKKDLGHSPSDHFKLRVLKLGNVIIDKPLDFRIGIQSSSTAALHAGMGDHSVFDCFAFGFSFLS